MKPLAAERSFQLLTQVAGRAGRADLAGEVIVTASDSAMHPVRVEARHGNEIGRAHV